MKPGPWRDEATGTPALITDAAWLYWPRVMRIHPLSRMLIVHGETRQLEIRVEFRDGDGHTSRAMGVMTLSLFDDDAGPQAGSLAQWRVDLRDGDENALRFDEVLRTYLVRLEPGALRFPARPLIHAAFESADGAFFEHHLVLRAGGE
ncbi:MAG: hypothetical protein KF817_05535 [Phycisphaeraceae bacterium]|nr:hypothetical protein [Phycisphaeraceae bacterium]